MIQRAESGEQREGGERREERKEGEAEDQLLTLFYMLGILLCLSLHDS